MNEKRSWWRILALLINLVAMLFLVLCITTNINDEVFLPVALGCCVAGNGLQFALNQKSKNGK